MNLLQEWRFKFHNSPNIFFCLSISLPLHNSRNDWAIAIKFSMVTNRTQEDVLVYFFHFYLAFWWCSILVYIHLILRVQEQHRYKIIWYQTLMTTHYTLLKNNLNNVFDDCLIISFESYQSHLCALWWLQKPSIDFQEQFCF